MKYNDKLHGKPMELIITLYDEIPQANFMREGKEPLSFPLPDEDNWQGFEYEGKLYDLNVFEDEMYAHEYSATIYPVDENGRTIVHGLLNGAPVVVLTNIPITYVQEPKIGLEKHIVIEVFPDAENAAIVTNEDGMNKVFTCKQDAQQEAADCQNGIVIQLG